MFFLFLLPSPIVLSVLLLFFVFHAFSHEAQQQSLPFNRTFIQHVFDSTLKPPSLSPPLSSSTSFRYQFNDSPFHSTLNKQPQVSVFLHAVVGIFKRRDNTSWGYGREIMEELLLEMGNSSDFIERTNATVFINIFGTDEGRKDSIELVKRLNSTLTFDKIKVGISNSNSNSYSKYKIFNPFVGKLHVILESRSIETAEFPTLFLMQQYAALVNPGSKLLYIHTKGVRKNGREEFYHEWRRYLTFFTINKYQACIQVLDKVADNHDELAGGLDEEEKVNENKNSFYNQHYAYDTCGTLKQRGIYAGNYWWSRADYLAKKYPPIHSLRWNMNNRYAAEEYILHKIAISQHQRHYCLHHTHHDMQVCSSPRSWYENINLTTLRKDSNCFSLKKMPKNRTKDPHSWCHWNGFPEI